MSSRPQKKPARSSGLRRALQPRHPLSDRVTAPSLIDLFEDAAHEHAEKTAILSTQGHAITYAALNGAANQVAHLLRRNQIGRGQIVAVLMSRGPGAYVAILGALKAGAAYLPIDPSYPRARVRQVFEQSRPRAVLTTSRHLHEAEVSSEAVVILLDELRQFQRAKRKSGRLFDAKDLQSSPHVDPPRQSRASDLAYVIFTSGSSGAPKGVMVEHRSVVNLIDWAMRTFSITPESRLAQSYSIAFDPSVQELFTALLSGATLLPMPDEVRLNPPRLLSWLTENAITYWDTVPSLWYRVVDYVKTRAVDAKIVLPHLETLVLGGEPLSGVKVRVWLDHVAQNHRIYNAYGPTEATVSAACFRVSADQTCSILPIGKPLSNNRIFVMDDALMPCAPGTVGEICVGGVGLARGYLNAPELTAAVFVEVASSGQRLYRTGDLGRQRPDGNVEFLGRKDDQFKVRGFRIESAEIEAALKTHRCVGEVAVTAFDDGETGHKMLVAFYTSTSHVTTDELRAYLGARLPAFMVPQHFARVGAFPLTPNGKIDKRALLAFPLDQDSPRHNPSEAPAGATEELLASIWRDVLHLKEIGANDNFFGVGGDSLLTVMVQHRCEQLGIRVRAIDIFRHPTVKDLARHIDASTLAPVEAAERGWADATISIADPTLLPPDAREVLPLLPSQKFLLREAGEHGGTAYMPQVVLRCEGTLDVEALERAVNVLVARHESLRTIFRTDLGTEPLQIVLADTRYHVALEDISALPPGAAEPAVSPTEVQDAFQPKKHPVASRSADAAPAALPRSPDEARQDEYVRRAAQATLERGFDLSRWPLFDITVYKRSGARFDIAWTIHHIIMDGWSTSMFYTELSRVYSGIVLKRFRPLPQHRSDVSDVVKHALNKDPRAARLFWTQHLKNAKPTRLPTDFARRAGAPRRIRSLSFALDATESQLLRSFARRHAVTVNSVCITAYFALLQHVTKQNDLTVGVTTSGRTDGVTGVEGVLGNLTHVVPMRLTLTTAKSFDALVQLAQRTLSDIIAHDHVDVDSIVELSASDATERRLDTIFVAENYPSPGELGMDPFSSFRIVGSFAKEHNGYPFTIVSSEEGGRLMFCFEYADELFTEVTIRAWSRRFLNVLREAR